MGITGKVVRVPFWNVLSWTIYLKAFECVLTIFFSYVKKGQKVNYGICNAIA